MDWYMHKMLKEIDNRNQYSIKILHSKRFNVDLESLKFSTNLLVLFYFSLRNIAGSYDHVYDAERAWAEHQQRMKEIERR